MMILCIYDCNAILELSINSNNEEDLNDSYYGFYKLLTKQGFQPKFHRLDNELSRKNEKWLTEKDVIIEIVQLYIHRRNAEEIEISTFKNHFIAVLCATHHDFPLCLWEDLIEQAVITVNLLRSSRIHPQLSANHSLIGAFDYTCTLLVPPGMRVIELMLSTMRGSWEACGKKGFYVSPATQHYRCCQIYMPSSRNIFVTDTIEYYNDDKFYINFLTLQEKLEASMTDLSENINNLKNNSINKIKIGE